MNENEPTDSKPTPPESNEPNPPAEGKSALDAAREKARAAAEAIRAHDFKGDARKAAEGMKNLQEKLRERGAPLVGTIASKARGRKPVVVGAAVAILLVVLLVLGRMLGSSGGESPESVAKAAFRALHDGDFDAYRAVTATEGIDPDLVETGFRFGNEIYKDCDFSDFKFGKARIEGDTAFVPWSLPGFGGDEMRLLRKNGGWRVWPGKDAPPDDLDWSAEPSSGDDGGSAASSPAGIAEAFVAAICKGDEGTLRKYADGPETLERALGLSRQARKEISRFAGASATLSDDPEADDCLVFEVQVRDSDVPGETAGMEVWLQQNDEDSAPRWVVCRVRL